VPLFRSLDRISGILQSASCIGDPRSLVGGRFLGCALHGWGKDELAKGDGQLLSDLGRYRGIGSFVHHVPFVLAILKFVVRHTRRR
jgi:hypothetical protein